MIVSLHPKNTKPRIPTLDHIPPSHHRIQPQPQIPPRLLRRNDTIIPQPRARIHTVALPLYPILQCGIRFANRLHYGRELLRAHDAHSCVGPHPHEPWPISPPAHAVVPGAVRRAHDHREVRDGAVADRVDHLGAVLDDAALLVLPADHVAGGVVQEQQRGVDLVGQLDELGRLLCLLGEQDPLRVGEDPDRVAVDVCEALQSE